MGKGETVIVENGIGQTEKADGSLIEKKGGKDLVKDKESASVSAEKTAVEESGYGISQNDDTILAETENPKVAEEVKQPKKRVREKPSGGKAEAKKLEVGEKKTKEPVMYVSFSTGRPVRERKSIERLVAAVEPESIRKLRLEKGRGAALKDIPNVANQLKKHKADETFKLLHFMLFGRHKKEFKSNLSEFSGFAWDENEEMHRSRIKEKLDRFVKERLFEFCYVLDIHIAKNARTTKEEIVVELLNFLAAPRVTTYVVPAENEQDEMVAELLNLLAAPRVTTDVVPTKNEQKRRKTVDTNEDEEKKSSHGKEDDSEEDKENENGVLDASEDEVAEHSQSKDEDSDPKEVDDPTEGSVKSSAKKEAFRKSVSKKTPTPKGTEHSKSKDEDSDSEEEAEEPKQASVESSAKKDASQKSELKKTPTPKKATTVSSPNKHSAPSTSKKVESSCGRTPVASSSKEKDVETAKRKHSAPSKSATNLTINKEKAGKKLVKGTDERSKGLNPSKDELRCKMAQMLHDVDFKTATGILKKLATHYDMDLTPKTYKYNQGRVDETRR